MLYFKSNFNPTGNKNQKEISSNTALVVFPRRERHRVVIVGSGISGFAAATTLLTSNLTDFVVLEASDRIGGRIHTVDFGELEMLKCTYFTPSKAAK